VTRTRVLQRRVETVAKLARAGGVGGRLDTFIVMRVLSWPVAFYTQDRADGALHL